MKLLLDECLPVDFRYQLPGYEVHTVEWAGFKGLKNGKLLRKAEDAGYDVLLTTDQGIPHQQNLAAHKISILIIRSHTNQIEDLLPVVGTILAMFAEIQPGQTTFTS
jgi:hypothetical protein